MSNLRYLLEKLHWKLVLLFNRKLRCFFKCYEECYERNKCDKLELAKEDIEKWYKEHVRCFTKCEEECIKKCFS